MKGKNGACYAPLTEILVCPDGRLRLYCMDIDKVESYGNLYEESFENVIKNNLLRLFLLREELINKERKLNLCKNCGFVNRMKGLYINKGDFRNKGSLIK